MNLPELQFVVDLDGTRVVLQEVREGFLRCMDCNATWCDHMEHALPEHEDASVLWERLDAFGDDGFKGIQVPIFPAQYGLYAEINLLECSIPDTRKVELVTAPSGSASTVIVGFVHPGEGRFAIRGMLIDWFTGMVETDHLECPQSGHSYAAQLKWEANMREQFAQLAEYWSVYFNHACLTCSSITPIDFSGLVPDDENRRRMSEPSAF